MLLYLYIQAQHSIMKVSICGNEKLSIVNFLEPLLGSYLLTRFLAISDYETSANQSSFKKYLHHVEMLLLITIQNVSFNLKGK